MTRLPEKYFLPLALLLHAVAAWFSIGWQHPDEHYQIVEFAEYLSGRVSASQLPWEFGAGMRPSFQVYLAAGVLESLRLIGVNNPFVLSFFLRFLIGLASVFALGFWHRKLEFKSPAESRLHLFLAFFFWALVYTQVRFSSETMGGIFLLLGVSFLWKSNGWSSVFISGMMLGLAFITRFQTGFFIAGIGFYFLAFEKKWVRTASILAAGFLPVLLLGLILDRGLYGYWVFTPWNYLDQNIFKNVAAGFGTEPWYWYLTQGFEKLIPPFSLLIPAGLALLCFSGSKERMVGFACLFFLLGHSVVGHKEWRFLFPLAFFIPYLATRAWQEFPDRLGNFSLERFRFWFGRTFLVLNFLLLVVVCFRPAFELAVTYRELFKIEKPAYLLFDKEDPYCSGNNEALFYINPNFRRMHLRSFDFVSSLKDGREIYIFTTSDKFLPVVKKSGAVQIYSSFPDWIYKVNFNNWLGRSSWYRIYKVPATKP